MTRCCFFKALLTMFGMLALTSARADTSWGMNDVTLIYPLPHYPREINELIAPQLAGLGGPLLAQSHFSRLAPVNQGESMSATYRQLRLVAVRLDPCFSSKGQCLRQVRLVWQPLDRSSYGSSTRFGLLEAKDAAIHSLHTLDPTSFESLLAEYGELKAAHGWDVSDEPLQVHPVLSKQGLNGAFAQGLRQLLTKYVGEQNLWRVTSMSTFVGGDEWSFQGFNLRKEGAQDIVIPRTQGARQQRFSLSSLSQTEFRNGQLSPVPLGSDNLQALLSNSRMLATAGSPVLKGLAASVARIENPSLHTPETMDCVSCHAAQTAGTLLFGRFAWLKQDPQHLESSFSSSQPLINLGSQQGNTHLLRALGYFERQLVLSRRVINETARVVERLNVEASWTSAPDRGGKDPGQAG